MEAKDLYLNKLQGDLNLQALSEDVRQEVLAFLKGEKETLVLPKCNHKVSYGLFYDLTTQMKGAQGELAKRAFYAASLLSSNQMMNSLEYWPNRYEIYSEVGIDTETVLRDIERNIKGMYNNAPIYIYEKIYKRIKAYEENPQTSELAVLFNHYGKAIEDMLEDKESRGIGIEETVFLRGYLAIIAHHAIKEAAEPNEEATVKYEEAIKQLEAALLNAITQIYAQEQVEAAYEAYFKTNLLAADLTFKKTMDQLIVRDRIERFVFMMALSCRAYSPIAANIVRLQLVLMGAEYSEQFLQGISFNDSYKLLGSLMDELQMPECFKIEAYSERCLGDAFEENAYWYENQLRQLYENCPDGFKATYEKLLEAKDIGAITLFTLLRKYGEAVDETKVSELEKICRRIKETERKGRRFKAHWEKQQAVIALLEVSEAAKEDTLAALEDEALEDILTKCQVASELFYKEANQDILEKLGSILGVKEIIIAGVERSPSLEQTSFINFVKAHLKEADEVVMQKIQEGQDVILEYVRTLYQQEIGMDYAVLVQVMNHRLKSVINFMEEFLKDKEALVRPHFKLLAKAKNKNMQEAIQRLEKKWDGKKCAQAIATKNNMAEAAQYIETIYTPGNDKYIPFSEQLNWSCVRDKEGNVVPSVVLKYYVSEYMLLKEIYIIEACELVKKFMNASDLTAFINSIYQLWLQNGADTKQKNVVLLYALNASAEGITLLKKQIDDWTENSRGALAAFSVTAMAMNGSSLALMLTDSIAQKYKNKQVRGAAQSAIEYVAQVRGISKEVLGDKIVPALGFNEKREITFDYGARSFKGILTPELEVVLFDEKGKKIKSLPKPNAQDDVESADRAKEHLKGLKKQMKAVITSQKLRLEKAMMTGRSWKRSDWEKLFVENPIMNGFAMSLIWAECNASGEILGTFRYMEDGSFNTVDEEEYIFHGKEGDKGDVGEEDAHEESVITLLHPIEIDSETVQAWKQQLEDYEVKQAIMQLDMPIYALTKAETEEKVINRFAGKGVYFGTIMGVMDKYDWKKTSITDGGGYDGYYYEDSTTGIGVKLNLDFVYVGMEATERVNLQDMLFYKAGTIQYGSYCYDDVTEQNCILPKAVPAKVLSFALMIGEAIAAKAAE